MATREADKLMVAEQILEVRYVPTGSFLDVRGYVADYIRESGFLPHWKIDINVVGFRDKADKAEKEGAFAGYRSAGYFAYDPPTRNFFMERAGSFWRTLTKNTFYKIPDIQRFGTRTKVFLPSERSFDEINQSVFNVLYSETAHKVLGGTEVDVQFIVDLKEEDFDVRVSGGPIHDKEAAKYFSFSSDNFEKRGMFIDVDYSKSKNVKSDDVTKLMRSAVDLTWRKVEGLAATIGV